jgi:hypothetical protein
LALSGHHRIRECPLLRQKQTLDPDRQAMAISPTTQQDLDVAKLRGIHTDPNVLVVRLRRAAAVPIVYMDTTMSQCCK